MAGTSDFYDLTYRHFADPVLAEIRRETFGRDIGQNSWLMADELERYIGWLEPDEASAVLDVACGSGGPTLFISRAVGCRVTGLDINQANLAAAQAQAHQLGPGHLGCRPARRRLSRAAGADLPGNPAHHAGQPRARPGAGLPARA
jgi:SAM-dependent methyltransferase